MTEVSELSDKHFTVAMIKCLSEWVITNICETSEKIKSFIKDIENLNKIKEDSYKSIILQ